MEGHLQRLADAWDCGQESFDSANVRTAEGLTDRRARCLHAGDGRMTSFLRALADELELVPGIDATLAELLQLYVRLVHLDKELCGACVDRDLDGANAFSHSDSHLFFLKRGARRRQPTQRRHPDTTSITCAERINALQLVAISALHGRYDPEKLITSESALRRSRKRPGHV
jgi:hypothetical protein